MRWRGESVRLPYSVALRILSSTVLQQIARGDDIIPVTAFYLQQLTEYAFEGIASCCACAEDTGVSCCQLEGTPCCCAAY